MRIDVMVNCSAGSVDAEEAKDQVRQIEAAFTEAGATASVRLVDPSDLQHEIERAVTGGFDAIVVAGGDGTVCSAAGVLAGTDTPLGVLPLGTFNHFAKDLGLADDLETAASQIASGEVGRVDVGEVNGRVFVNNSALGVYPAMVGIRDSIRSRRGWGKVRAVPVAVVRVLHKFPLHRLTLATADGPLSTRVRTPLVFVGNGRYQNADGGLGERSSLAGGTLGVFVARVVSRWGLVRTVLGALIRGVDRAADLDQLETVELTVTSRTRSLDVAIDGEVERFALPLRYRIRPGALLVVAPTGSTAVAADEPVGPTSAARP